MRNTKIYRVILTRLLAFLALLFFGATTITAAPGDLDPTFGNGGIAMANRGNNPIVQLYSASAMAIQPDGKIVVVGQGVGEPHGANWECAVVRFNPDGSLDTSLGGTGIVINPVGHGFYSVAIQPDGKIVVVSSVAIGTFAVVRYNPNGSLDTSFNGSGIVLTPVDSDGGGPSSVAIQTDGKIVVAGSNGDNSFAILRYNPNGSLDTTFNGSGLVITPDGNAYSVAIQADGKIIAAGESRGVVSQRGFTLVRYNSDGSLDTSLNGTGIVITPVGDAGSGASDLAIQPDGKIVVVGLGLAAHGSFFFAHFAVARYNPDGSLDTSFGGTGKILIPIGDSVSDYASSVAIQPNGKIVVGGIRNSSLTSEFAVGRLNPNGSVDTSFHGTGIVTTSVGGEANNYDEGSSIAIQADGKIVVAGDTGPDEFKSFVVIRYQGDSATPTSCPNPIDCNDSFVRQHYRDFLNREPDDGGLAYWTNRITECGSDPSCIHDRRIGVSAAFFVEMEFQETGYYVDRFYKASFGRQPNYAEFTADRGSVIGGSNLEASKQTFADQWVQRPAFLAAYPITMSNTEFVNKLFDTASLTASTYNPQRQQEIDAMNVGRSRALILRDVIEIPDFKNIPDPNDPRYSEIKQTSQYNAAFVLMQYFGYLRRDMDQSGYQFWLDVLNNREPNNYRAMVCAFITSTEYQSRFASTITRSNSDCGQ
jgi:uncharacterized delta-60 repeat protein